MTSQRQGKPKLSHPDFWKRMSKAAKQVEHLPCWQMGTRENKRPVHKTKIVAIGSHQLVISLDCRYCGQPFTIKQIVKALKNLRNEND